MTATIPPQTATNHLRLGARGSLLSRMQSQGVADTLQRLRPGLQVALQIVTTSGDRIQDRPLHAFGGKGLFTKELEQALLSGDVDFAVHSFKDVPVTMPLVDQADLVIAAVPAREDARDVLVSRKARSLRDLPHGARVGTGSLRRKAQVLARRPDLNVSLIRGNVDTRIRKMRDREFDAVILALAGLKRAGLFDPSEMCALALDEFIPAAAQGALALQCRQVDVRTQRILAALDDPDTALCVKIERMIVARLNGDCHSPIAAHATVAGGRVTLRTAVARRDGHPPVIRASAAAGICEAEQAVAAVMAELTEQGVMHLLHTA